MKLASYRALSQQIDHDILMPRYEAEVQLASIRSRGQEDGELAPAPIAFSSGLSNTKGKPDSFQVAVRYTEMTKEVARLVQQIRKLAAGEIDAQETGEVSAWHPSVSPPWQQGESRPLEPGISVGCDDDTGTLGFFVIDAEGKLCILSNAHVLANVNRGKIGDPILQPGKADHGAAPADVVAYLKKSSRIYYAPGRRNLVDAALAQVAAGVDLKADAVIRGIGSIPRVDANDVEDLLGQTVRKLGRTTGLTTGVVTAVELKHLPVAMEPGRLAYFDDQIEIQAADISGPFSLGGDSGSLIITSANEACALLFAGADTGGRHGLGRTYANPIATVLTRMECRLIDSAA